MALQVETSVPVFGDVPYMFNIGERQLADFKVKYMLEQFLDKAFVLLLSEDQLKAYIDHRVDVACGFDNCVHNSKVL